MFCLRMLVNKFVCAADRASRQRAELESGPGGLHGFRAAARVATVTGEFNGVFCRLAIGAAIFAVLGSGASARRVGALLFFIGHYWTSGRNTCTSETKVVVRSFGEENTAG